MDRLGVDSMAGQLTHVAMRRPRAILTADHGEWHYSKQIDAARMAAQYDAFAAELEAAGATIHWLPDTEDGLADSIFTYDPSFVIPDGAVILRPGKTQRSDEVDLHRAFYGTVMPILGEVEAPGTIEGGDIFWLNEKTLAVGRGFRTIQAGIDQFAAIVGRYGISVEQFDLPYGKGPDACLHLLSVVNPLDVDLALVKADLVPAPLFDRMARLGYELIDVPQEEFDASAGLNLNALATAPRRCLAIAGFPRTVAMMEAAGCTVTTFDADELCLPCEGGPTCLTRPLARTR